MAVLAVHRCLPGWFCTAYKGERRGDANIFNIPILLLAAIAANGCCSCREVPMPGGEVAR